MNNREYDEKKPIGQSSARSRDIPGRYKYDMPIDQHTQFKMREGSHQEHRAYDGTSMRPSSAVQPNLHPLLKQASTASVCVLFGLLMWRSLSSYELADQFLNDYVRLIAIIPVVGILIANIIGFVVNLAQPLNFKTHLKVILAVNVLREWIEMAYNVMMLIASSSKSAIPREAYFGRLFMNIWWSLLCFSFSKSRWVLQSMEAHQAANPPPAPRF